MKQLNTTKNNVTASIDLLKHSTKAKFNETVEVALNLNLPKSLPSVRGFIDLPNNHNKKVKLLVLSPEAVDGVSENDVYSTAEDVPSLGGKMSKMDIAVTAISYMPQVSKVAKILGPKGLMPNPKTGSVGDNVIGVINLFRNNRITFQSDKTGIVHCGIGKIDMDTQSLAQNLNAVIDAITSLKPDKTTDFIKSVYVSSTMGKAYRIEK